MLREQLKQELDKLNETQLSQIADFIKQIEISPQHSDTADTTIPLWKTATSEERTRDFQEWVKQLPHNSQSLPDTAFDRDSIYR